MNKEDIKKALVEWGKRLQDPDPEFEEVVRLSYNKNQWFTPDNIKKGLDNIVQNFLQEDKLDQWLKMYPNLQLPQRPKEIGIVMAGNIPLVGFHDLLAILITGNAAKVKLSSKDPYLVPFVIGKLGEASPVLADRIKFVELLKNVDAIIATGSNNTGRYFEFYFSRYPNIIRRNRSSVAVLSGEESKEEIHALGEDIFAYFGLGCRNISKLYIPEGYNIPEFLDRLEVFHDIKEHKKYKNNLDFNLTMLLMNKMPHYASEFLILEEKDQIGSPVGIVYYEFYKNKQDLHHKLEQHKEQIQVIETKMELDVDTVPLGNAQQPQLWDYADKVDVVEFLRGLK